MRGDVHSYGSVPVDIFVRNAPRDMERRHTIQVPAVTMMSGRFAVVRRLIAEALGVLSMTLLCGKHGSMQRKTRWRTSARCLLALLMSGYIWLQMRSEKQVVLQVGPWLGLSGGCGVLLCWKMNSGPCGYAREIEPLKMRTLMQPTRSGVHIFLGWGVSTFQVHSR